MILQQKISYVWSSPFDIKPMYFEKTYRNVCPINV